MSVEGELSIELECREQQVEKVNIRSSRPLQLPTLFEGKPVSEVLRMIPMLYSVCANAQAMAAVTSCRQAMGVTVDARVSMAESMLVWCETGREHLLRILIDWPGFCGEATDQALFKDLSELMKHARGACFGDQSEVFSLQPLLQIDADGVRRIIELLSERSSQAVFGMPASQWQAIDELDGYYRWIENRATLPARLLAGIRDEGNEQVGDLEVSALPSFEPDEIEERLEAADADAFVSAPDWHGVPCETTALIRQGAHPLIRALREVYGNGLITRMTARLLELAVIPGLLSDKLQAILSTEVKPVNSEITGTGKGVGIVEAARGRLTHRVLVEQGRIGRYQILAPTEWNFHPSGVVAQALRRLPANDEAGLRRLANLFINAVDPCVGYRLEVV